MKKLISAILLLAMLYAVASAEKSLPDLSNISVGDVVTFGSYEQDNRQNGTEPIQWIVLDVQDGKALLLSKYGLDNQRYNNKYEEVTWETCSLRAWLNNEFMKAAFSETEQPAILMTDVDNSDAQGFDWKAVGVTENITGGNNTQDYIFLLSYAEANRYLGVTVEDIDNTKSRVAPTAYSVAQGTYVPGDFRTADGEYSGWWWLRSPGYIQSYATSVDHDGSFGYCGVRSSTSCVRPAFWLNLNPDI